MEVIELLKNLKKNEKNGKKNETMLQITGMKTRRTFAEIVIDRWKNEPCINNNGDKK
jgi:hypothetical protein